ncbi:MAG: hypothetical protein ACTSPI_10605, partial [Candidatus Heimdallarchaeaceae archaeon]
EIRYHFPGLELSRKMKESISFARTLDWNVGIEVPAIPRMKSQLIEIISFAIEKSLDFVNLNEFEFSETNFNQLKNRNFEPLSTTQSAVKGSKKLALNLLKQFKKDSITLHFCSSRYKDKVQLRNRFLRRAHNFARDFDEVTEEGLIVRGRIKVVNKAATLELSKYLNSRYKIKPNMLEINEKGNELYTHYEIVKELGKSFEQAFSDKIIQVAVIHQYPMDDGFITYLEPIIDNEIYS